MPRLTNSSLYLLPHSVPGPQIFPGLTLKQSYSQVIGSLYYDLCLVCEDGLVATNQCVMAAASGFLRKLLGESHLLEEGRTGRKQDLVVIHLPELDHTSVNRVVTCFTEGVVKLPLTGGWGDQSVKMNLEAAWRVLGIDRVDLEEIFKNVSVQANTIEDDVDISQAEFIVDIGEDEVPDRLQTLCNNGVISIGGVGERKRKVDDDDFSEGSDDDPRDQDWKPSKSSRNTSVPIILPKRRKSYDPEPLTYSKQTFIKSEPTVVDEVMEESVVVKIEPTNKTVNLAATENSKPNTRSRSSRSVLSSTPVIPQTTSVPSQPSLKAPSRIVTVHPPAATVHTPPTTTNTHPSQRQPSLKMLPANVQPQATSSLSKAEVAERRAKIDQTPFALDPVTCFVCDKTEDKDGKSLNMKNLFYLRNHFAKCLYNSGKVFAAVPPGPKNTDENGGPKDEFGQNKDHMYKCTVAGCWLQMKKGIHSQVCYKVYAIHLVSQHGVMEKLLEEDIREEPQHLLQKIRAYENCEVLIESPRKAKVPMIVKMEGDKKRKERMENNFQEIKAIKKASSNVSLEPVVGSRDDDTEDPDDPAELSEIVELPQIEKFKTFDRTEDINVFRRFNPSGSNPQTSFTSSNPVQKRLSLDRSVSLSSVNARRNIEATPSHPATILDEKYRLGKDGNHTCFLCHGIAIGTNSKDSQHLSFKNLIKLKEHYSRCIYKEGNMHKYVDPEEDNVDTQGKPIDEFGKINGKMYKCKIQGCWLQRKLGLRGHVCYKVYAIHMASQHGVLENILEDDDRLFLKEILNGIRKEEGGKAGIARCRFESCKDIQFKVEPNKRELKMHYSTKHFRRWFEGRDRKGLDRMPSMEFSAKGGTRATCERCSDESKKPIYIQGDNEAIMGHLVVKHDLLADALREAGDSVKEAKDVVKDLYPDQVTQFYMATLSSRQGAIPLNEDFMDKMFI